MGDLLDARSARIDLARSLIPIDVINDPAAEVEKYNSRVRAKRKRPPSNDEPSSQRQKLNEGNENVPPLNNNTNDTQSMQTVSIPTADSGICLMNESAADALADLGLGNILAPLPVKPKNIQRNENAKRSSVINQPKSMTLRTVTLSDLLFVMENDPRLNNTQLLYAAYLINQQPTKSLTANKSQINSISQSQSEQIIPRKSTQQISNFNSNVSNANIDQSDERSDSNGKSNESISKVNSTKSKSNQSDLPPELPSDDFQTNNQNGNFSNSRIQNGNVNENDNDMLNNSLMSIDNNQDNINNSDGSMEIDVNDLESFLAGFT